MKLPSSRTNIQRAIDLYDEFNNLSLQRYNNNNINFYFWNSLKK